MPYQRRRRGLVRIIQNPTVASSSTALGVRRPDEALWSDTEEGRQRERSEREQALRRYRELWGREPV